MIKYRYIYILLLLPCPKITILTLEGGVKLDQLYISFSKKKRKISVKTISLMQGVVFLYCYYCLLPGG